jgi:hypothetical protein
MSSVRAHGVVVFAVLAATGAAAGEVTVDGILSMRAIGVRGQPSWLQGGYGRLPEGANDPGDWALREPAQGHLGLDWKPSETARLHVQGVVNPGTLGADAHAGFTEAYAQYAPELTPKVALRLRAGTLFPGTSRENVGPLWSSPYTVTLSALNTWTAEELRLTGLESLLRLTSSHGDELQLGGVVFRGNDTQGTLLAWRGWSVGDRITTLRETLPLPPLRSLAPGGGFEGQRRGTRPFDELDGRPGWQARARWERPQALLVQASYLDNRGDRALHRGQYSWRSRFATVGAELHLSRSVRLILEGMSGNTGMGVTTGPHVDLDFRVGYALLSWGGEKGRVSARLEGFRNRDLVDSEEPNQESGYALTGAAFWQPRRVFRVGIEVLEVRSQRPAAEDSGADPDAGGRQVLLEMRLTF